MQYIRECVRKRQQVSLCSNFTFCYFCVSDRRCLSQPENIIPEPAFPGCDRGTHLVHVRVPVIDRGDAGDRSRNMVEQFFGDVIGVPSAARPVAKVRRKSCSVQGATPTEPLIEPGFQFAPSVHNANRDPISEFAGRREYIVARAR